LRDFPNSERIERGLGLTLEALGHTEQAERYLRHAANTETPEALSDYGEFLFRQGRLTESITVLKRSGNKATLDRAMRALEATSRQRGHAFEVAPARFSRIELPMIVKNGAAGEKHQIETMIAGVAVLDYDGDGWPDIYVANGALIPSLDKADPSFFNRLFRNNHDGSFTDVTRKAGVAGRGYRMGVAAADYDNDGDQDLFITGVRENTLYRNRGDGTFEDISV
jgi:hypothetical protein